MEDSVNLLPLPEPEQSSLYTAEQMSEYARRNILKDRLPYWDHKSWKAPTPDELEEYRRYTRAIKPGDILPCAHCGKSMEDVDDFDNTPYPLNRYHDCYVLECHQCSSCVYAGSPKACVEKWNKRALPHGYRLVPMSSPGE